MDESDSNPNPFLDFRFQVVFVSPDGKVYDVPGFFAGNGEGGGEGDVWRVIFTPDQPGKWLYHTVFEKQEEVALHTEDTVHAVGGTISTDTTWLANNNPYLVTHTITVTDNATLTISNDVQVYLMDGVKLNTAKGGKISIAGSNIKITPNIGGSFEVGDSDSTAPGFLSKGRLVNDGTYYLKCSGDDSYWIKGGTNSPENFLAYYEFDGTPDKHFYSTHNNDSQSPIFENILGAINYIASKQVNSIYMLLMNIGGDGKDVHPYLSDRINLDGDPENDNLHFDISKLFQWDVIFRHCQEKGIHLHFVLSEGEYQNKMELDDATLGPERKLFYREMVARFGYHNAVTWNLCEEYDYPELPITAQMAKSWAQYLENLDPYDHSITIHNFENTLAGGWEEFYGDNCFGAVSQQFLSYPFSSHNYAQKVCYVRDQTAKSKWRIPVCLDETLKSSKDPTMHGCDYTQTVCGVEHIRKEVIYPVYYSGGQLELFLEEMLAVEDFRIYESVWDYMWYARNSLNGLDIVSMEPHHDYLNITAGLCFTNDEQYAVYLPNGGECLLNLANGTFQLKFYNPRTGKFTAGEEEVEGGKTIDIDCPSLEDWVIILVRK